MAKLSEEDDGKSGDKSECCDNCNEPLKTLLGNCNQKHENIPLRKCCIGTKERFHSQVLLMEQRIQEIKRYYVENLRPKEFHKLCQEDLSHSNNAFLPALNVVYQIMKKGKFRGSRLLEIGSGPTVHNIASASAYFPEIVQSDFLEANCEELRRWLSGKSQLDWSHYLGAVAKIEGYEDINLGRQEIEFRIRRSVKCVVHCDVFSDLVIPEEVMTEYDLIVTSLTLESAAPDFDSYVGILKKLNRLLRTGGGLLMIGFLNSSTWSTDGGTFPYLKVKQSDIDEALDIAGFKEKEWTLLPDIPERKEQEFYVVASVKM